MMKFEDVKAGMMCRAKSGKLYKVHADEYGRPCWTRETVRDNKGNVVWRDTGNGYKMAETTSDFTRVRATQWQVNEKYPQGRFYQASRDLKIAELEPAE